MSDADKQPTNQNIDTGGGAHIGGDASAGADVVGRDKYTADKLEVHHHYGSTQSDTPPSPPLTPPDVPCPYRGLEFFDTQHAANYFGRQAMTDKLLAKVQECNFITVVGPSGSGKSSLVRAGLMVALQKGAIAGSQDWKVETFRPGEHPLQALAGSLLKLNPSLSDVDRWTEIEKLAKRLGNGELSIGLVLDQLRGSTPKLVLIVDQFEETFTLCSDETLRNRFFDTLLAATDSNTGKPWLSVIFTLRADFYGRVLEQEALSKRVDVGLVNVLPMTHEERRAAIEQPALQAGRHFESGLVERIVAAVEAEPGQLPLLEFALTELWTRQSAEGTLTHAAYETIGEVSGAIAKRADDTLRSLLKADQERVRTIFTRLVRVAPPDEGSDDTKRRLLLNELDPSLRPLVQSLADARLLVTGRDEQQKSDTVEVAHEALIRGWGALQTWLNSDREFLLWRQRLRTLVENWQATHKDEGSLLRGATLNEAQGWLAARTNELGQSEQTFIVESQNATAREVAEREAARQRQLEQERALTESQRLRAEEQQKRAESERKRAEEQTSAAQNLRRRNQYLRAALALVAFAALIAVYFWSDSRTKQQTAQSEADARATEVVVRSTAEAVAVLSEAEAKSAADARATEVVQRTNAQATAVAEKDRADQNAADAEKAKRRAQAGEMAARVETNITQMNGVDDATILLAREAVLTTLKVDNYVTINADRALRNVVDNASWSTNLPKSTSVGTVISASFSPDGKTILSRHSDGTFKLWDVKTGLERYTSPMVIGPVIYSPDSRTIFATPVTPLGALKLLLLNVETGLNQSKFGGYFVLNAFSPDSETLLAVGPFKKSLMLWDAKTGNNTYTLDSHGNSIAFAEFSPDGKRVLAANDDNTLTLWDIQTGKELRTFQGYTKSILYAEFSPDGKSILSVGDANTIKIWESETGNQKFEIINYFPVGSGLSSTDLRLRVATYSPQGAKILSSNDENEIKLWNANTGKELLTLSGHKSNINSTIFSPDGNTLVSTSQDGTLKLWDVNTGRELRTIRSGFEFDAATFSPDGKQILGVSRNGNSLTLWDSHVEKELHTFVVSQPVKSALFSPDGDSVLSVSTNDIFRQEISRTQDGLLVTSSPINPERTIRLWSVQSAHEIDTRLNYTTSTQAASFSPDGKSIFSVDDCELNNCQLKLWDVQSGQKLYTISVQSTCASSITHSPDNKWLACLNYDKPKGSIPSMRLSDGTTVVSAGPLFSFGNTLKLWNATTGHEIHSSFSTAKNIIFVGFSPDSKTFVTADTEQIITLWNVASGDEIRKFKGHTSSIIAVTFSMDRKTLISVSSDQITKFWDVASGNDIRTLGGNGSPTVNSATFSPDRTTMVLKPPSSEFSSISLNSSSINNALTLWDLVSGKTISILNSHSKQVNSIVYSPDGKTIATASDDQTIKIWDSTNGNELRTLTGHMDKVLSVAFSPDGKWIVSASDDGTVRIWVASIEDLLQMAEARIQRPVHQLTDEERLQYGLELTPAVQQ